MGLTDTKYLLEKYHDTYRSNRTWHRGGVERVSPYLASTGHLILASALMKLKQTAVYDCAAPFCFLLIESKNRTIWVHLLTLI